MLQHSPSGALLDDAEVNLQPLLKQLDVELSLTPNDEFGVLIQAIWSHGTRGAGNGGLVLRKLCELADKHGAELHAAVHPLSYGESDNDSTDVAERLAQMDAQALGNQQLESWYYRHGFIRQPEADLHNPELIRRPTGQCTLANDCGIDPTKLQAIRDFLAKKWITWGEERSKSVTERGEGMCRFTSTFLLELLGEEWRFAGGLNDAFNWETGRWEPCDGGFYNIQGGSLGVWESHHWVTNDRVILDLTASQWGLNPILVVPAHDSRYKETMFESDIDEALRDVRDRAAAWLNEYRRLNAKPRASASRG